MKPIIRWPRVLALWLVCTAAFGQTAKITGPAKAPAGYPVRLDTAGSQGTTFEWTVVPVGAAPSLSPDRDGRSLVFANPRNGLYTVGLIVNRGTPDQSSTWHNLTLTDGGPIPPPPPPPPPPPGELARLVIIAETEDQTPEQAAVILSMEWRSRLDAGGIPFEIADQHAKDSTGATTPRLVKAAKAAAGSGLPAVVCLDGAGNVIGTHPLPATEAGMTTLLDRYEVEP